jgi:uncharacterized phage-associated protein
MTVTAGSRVKVMTDRSAQDVAGELRRRLPGVGVKKLHKLLYYCQGHHLAALGSPLFVESVSAWDMGPVVGALWHAERHGDPPPTGDDLSESELNTLGYVISRYGALTGADLERLTHGETPWSDADRGRTPGTSTRIPNDALERFFRRQDGDEEQETPLPDGMVRDWLAGAKDRTPPDPRPDSRARLAARLAAANDR